MWYINFRGNDGKAKSIKIGILNRKEDGTIDVVKSIKNISYFIATLAAVAGASLTIAHKILFIPNVKKLIHEESYTKSQTDSLIMVSSDKNIKLFVKEILVVKQMLIDEYGSNAYKKAADKVKTQNIQID